MFTSTWRKGAQWLLAGSLATISLTGYAASEYRVAMQAGSGHYLSAVNNGGGDVNASGGALDLWESFTLIDTNGGKLEHGDPVHIWTSAARYFHAEHAGGANLTATAPHALSWETFHIERADGQPGEIRHNDAVGFRGVNGYYIQALNNGGSSANMHAQHLLSWETFRLKIIEDRSVYDQWSEIRVEGEGCLDAYGGYPGANVYVYEHCHGGDNQLWRLGPNNLLHSKAGDHLCLGLSDLSVQGGQIQPGANAQLEYCNSTQLGQLFASRAGRLALFVQDGDQCLDMHNDTHNVYNYHCHEGHNQQFRFTRDTHVALRAALPASAHAFFDALSPYLALNEVQALPRGENEVAKISGVLHTGALANASGPAAPALKAMLDLAAQFGMARPTPVTLTATVDPLTQSLDMALAFRMVDTHKQVEWGSIGLALKTIDTTFHWIVDLSSGDIATPIDVQGYGFLKPTLLDPWLEVAPRITIEVDAEGGLSRTIGGDIIGQCDFTPDVHTQPGACHSRWNVLDVGTVFGDQSSDQNSDQAIIGAFDIGFNTSGFAEAIGMNILDGELHIAGQTLDFRGVGATDWNDANNWHMAINVDVYGQSVLFEQNFRPDLSLWEARVPVYAFPAEGELVYALSEQSIDVNFEGALCVHMLEPNPLGWLSGDILRKYCTPQQTFAVGSDGKVSTHFMGVDIEADLF